MQSHATETYTLKIYDLNQATCQEINPAKAVTFSATTSKLFYFNKLSLLTGKRHTELWRLNLYQIESTHASWETPPNFKHSISKADFDFENSIPISYHKNDVIILVSVVANRITFHGFSQRPEKNKKLAASLLHREKLKLSSCIMLSDYIFCCLLLPKTGSYIYKFGLASIQQHRKDSDIQSVCVWQLKNSALQNCFLSVRKEEIVVFDGSNMEIRKLLSKPLQVSSVESSLNQKSFKVLEVSSAEPIFKFPHGNIIATSVIPGFQNHVIAVVYYNSKTNKHYIKRVS